MSISFHNWTECGGTGKINDIKIRISDVLGKQCTTKSQQFAGQEIVWDTEDLLLDCTEIFFHQSQSLQVTVLDQEEVEIKCSVMKLLEVVFNCGTIYRSSESNPNQLLYALSIKRKTKTRCS